jgi:hypothetical protein
VASDHEKCGSMIKSVYKRRGPHNLLGVRYHLEHAKIFELVIGFLQRAQYCNVTTSPENEMTILVKYLHTSTKKLKYV